MRTKSLKIIHQAQIRIPPVFASDLQLGQQQQQCVFMDSWGYRAQNIVFLQNPFCSTNTHCQCQFFVSTLTEDQNFSIGSVPIQRIINKNTLLDYNFKSSQFCFYGQYAYIGTVDEDLANAKYLIFDINYIFINPRNLIILKLLIKDIDSQNNITLTSQMHHRNITQLSYIGACFSSGQPIKGVQLGPKAVRESGIFQGLHENYGVKVNDRGDVTQVTDVKPIHKTHINNLHVLDPSLKKLNDKVTEVLNSINDQNQIIVTVGGDHSVGTGTIHAVLGKYPDLKLIWVDAHGDIIDASKSSYPGYHGMPLSHLLGVNDGHIPGFQWMTRRIKPENVVHIGGRDIDHDEWTTLKRLKIKCFTPDHIDQLGIGEVMRQAFQYLDPVKNTNQPHKSAPFHISFDIDAMDPEYAQATGTRYRGGLVPREAFHIIRRTAHEKKFVSMDIVEINPSMPDVPRKHYRGEEHYKKDLTQTVGMGIDLMDSIFKKYLTL